MSPKVTISFLVRQKSCYVLNFFVDILETIIIHVDIFLNERFWRDRKDIYFGVGNCFVSRYFCSI